MLTTNQFLKLFQLYKEPVESLYPVGMIDLQDDYTSHSRKPNFAFIHPKGDLVWFMNTTKSTNQLWDEYFEEERAFPFASIRNVHVKEDVQEFSDAITYGQRLTRSVIHMQLPSAKLSGKVNAMKTFQKLQEQAMMGLHMDVFDVVEPDSRSEFTIYSFGEVDREGTIVWLAVRTL